MTDRTTTIVMSMSTVTVTWKSTAMTMRRTGVTMISRLRTKVVLCEGRAAAGVFGRCPGLHEGRASVTRGEHAWADLGYLRVRRTNPGLPRVPRRPRGRYVQSRAQATRGLFRVSGGMHHREEAREGHPGGSGVAGRGHEGHAGFRQGGTGAHRPGNTGVKPGCLPRLRAGCRRFSYRGHPGQTRSPGPGHDRGTSIPGRQPAVTPGSTRVGCMQGGTKAKPEHNPGVTRM